MKEAKGMCPACAPTRCAGGAFLFMFVLNLFHVDYLKKLREQFCRIECLTDEWYREPRYPKCTDMPTICFEMNISETAATCRGNLMFSRYSIGNNVPRQEVLELKICWDMLGKDFGMSGQPLILRKLSLNR